MSKSLKFKTRSWWYDEQDEENQSFNYSIDRKNSLLPISIANQNTKLNFQTLNSAKQSTNALQNAYPDHKKKQISSKRRSTKDLMLFLAPPAWWRSSRRTCDNNQNDTPSEESAKLSITSFDYQIN